MKNALELLQRIRARVGGQCDITLGIESDLKIITIMVSWPTGSSFQKGFSFIDILTVYNDQMLIDSFVAAAKQARLEVKA